MDIDICYSFIYYSDKDQQITYSFMGTWRHLNLYGVRVVVTQGKNNTLWDKHLTAQLVEFIIVLLKPLKFWILQYL